MHAIEQPLEVLTFKLGAEEYGIEIHTVQELSGYKAVTRIANTPENIKGVVNLRGLIMPIIDMRIKFNGGMPVYNEFTMVIILTVGKNVLGMVVDNVSDVINLTRAQLKPPPHIGTAFKTEYLVGMGVIDERMLILLAIGKLMAGFDIGLIEQLAA